MVAFNVFVISATKADKKKADLFLASGILKFEDGTFSHITNEKTMGREIIERIEEVPAPSLVETPIEAKKEELPEVKEKSLPRSESAKKNKKKG